MSNSIFKIQGEYLELMQTLIDNDGEITEEIQDQLSLTVDQLTKKSDNYVAVIRHLELDNKGIDEEIKRLQSIKKVRVNAVNRLKESLQNAMITFDLKEIQTPTNKINFRKSETVEINCDIDDLPAELTILERKAISKTEIKKKLKEGKVYAGIELKENKNLQIK